MSKLRNLSIIILTALATAAAQQAQDAPATKHFEKDGLTFDYPAQWQLTDDNTPEVRSVTMKPEAGATQIIVVLYRGRVPSCDFEAEGKKITDALSKRVAIVIQAGDAFVSEPVKTKAGGSEVEGAELHGIIKNAPAIGDVYSFRLNRQFVSFVYVRKVDDERANAAWDLVRTTLKVEPSATGVVTVEGERRPKSAPITGWVLNGRALSLPHPDYPPLARAAHASGTVVVQVTIDESGAVIAAHAVSGHPLLQPASVAAAKRARFSPTKLCGEPVRVTGIITYNFFAM